MILIDLLTQGELTYTLYTNNSVEYNIMFLKKIKSKNVFYYL